MFRLDQKGISLPLVLAILGIVVANTFYFMNVDEETKKQNIKRSNEIEDNTEKMRLISYLSDSKICNQFFSGQVVPYSSTAPLAKGGVNFLAPGTLYARNSLQFSSYQIRLTNNSPTAVQPALEKRYSLFVTYTIMDRRPVPPVPTLKTKVVRLPLNIVFQTPPAISMTGSPPNPINPIKTCYTNPTNDIDTISETVINSCLGDGVLFVAGNPPECQHNQPNASCTGDNVFTGVTAGANGSLAFSCGRPVNAGGATGTEQCSITPIKTLLYEITNVDKFNCRSADNACAQGDLLVMGASGDHICAKPCSSTSLFNKMNPNGIPTCLDKPKTCPLPNQYARTVYANGDIDCADYPILGKSCSAGKFATDLDPTKSNGDLALKCQTLSKIKRCSAPSDVTFVQSFQTAVPSCYAYTN